MTKLTSHLNVKTFATALAFAAAVATTSVGAEGANTLDDAITDYSRTDSLFTQDSTYDTDARDETWTALETEHYDYTPRSDGSLEEGEFAAFEVPDVLNVSD